MVAKDKNEFKNKTSENMQKMYADKRASSTQKVQEAINFIQGENREVTKKELMELTGLSSGTFSQAHIKAILEKNQVCQFKPLKKISIEEKRAETQSEIIERLSKQIKKQESKLQDYDIILEKKINDCKKLKEENKKLDHEYRLLRGKYQELLEYIEILGGDLSKFNIK